MSDGDNVVRLAAERGADVDSVGRLQCALADAQAGELRDVIVVGTAPAGV